MKILYQAAIIFTLCLIGEAVSYILPFPFPSAICAMILLTAALFFRIIKIEQVEDFGDFLLSNMAFFFVPAGIRVIEHFDIIKAIWLQFLVIVLAATFLVFLVTAGSVTLVLKLEQRRKGK